MQLTQPTGTMQIGSSQGSMGLMTLTAHMNGCC
jgi:hypothetical protein